MQQPQGDQRTNAFQFAVHIQIRKVLSCDDGVRSQTTDLLTSLGRFRNTAHEGAAFCSWARGILDRIVSHHSEGSHFKFHRALAHSLDAPPAIECCRLWFPAMGDATDFGPVVRRHREVMGFMSR